MIFKIKKYFKSKKNKYFQNELVDKLHKEHEKLFDIVGKMDEAVEKKNIRKLKKLIKSFTQELELHVLYEDTNLYEHLYLRYHYYLEVKDSIQKKHNEIKDIAVAVEDFINNHKKLNIDEFKEEFEMIKEVLVKRVNFEEKALYDIYVNNYKISTVLNKLSNV